MRSSDVTPEQIVFCWLLVLSTYQGDNQVSQCHVILVENALSVCRQI
jgi:hypothetical protein